MESLEKYSVSRTFLLYNIALFFYRIFNAKSNFTARDPDHGK